MAFKHYGSIERLVSILFLKDGFAITARPNQATTYTAARDIQLPPGDAAHVLMSANSTATMTNKSFDANGTGNSLSNVDLADLSSAFLLSVAKGGTNSSTSLNNNRVMQSSGGAIVEAAAITAARALISDANGIPTHSATTATELGYVNGVTSAIQTQLGGKASTALNNLTVASLAAGSLLVGASSSAVSNLAVGSDGDVLTVVSGSPAWAPAASSFSSFKATWLLADGASKSITHSLGSTDVIVQLFDTISGETISVDSAVRTDPNTVDLTASEAPAVAWRVLILAV